MEESKEETIYINSNTTLIIKGIALVFMFIHHFFAFPNWYVEGISYPYLQNITGLLDETLKICVPIFAFFTGYLYFFNKNKNIKYSIKKITDILIVYWITYILLYSIALIIGYMKFDIINVIKELFNLYLPIMYFCWYVRFYVGTMLVLPAVSKLLNKNVIISLLVGVFMPIVLGMLLFECFRGCDIAIEIILDFIKFFPCVTIGYIFARFSIFNKYWDKILNKYMDSKVLKVILFISLAAIVILMRGISQILFIPPGVITRKIGYIISLDIIYAPIFIYSMVNLIKLIPSPKMNFILEKIGKYSLLMWFSHSIFFNVSKEFFQPILYWPKNPILVVIWGIALSYLMAVIINIPIKKILKFKNS